MNKLNTIKQTLVKTTGRAGLQLKKYSPEILVGVGVAGIIGSTIMACKATLKVDDVINDAKENFENIEYALENLNNEVTYTDKDAQKDKTIVYVQTGVKLAKLYGPSIILGAASVGCILGSHNIMKKRNFAVVAAYKALEERYNNYRRRVVEEFGIDKDRQYKSGIIRTEETVVETDEDGKKKKVKKIVDINDPNYKSIYARFYDDGATSWSKTPEYNLMFLKTQQNYANDLLKARGHIFLNEVYDMIGIPRSSEGSVVGWVLNDDNDNFVDFGIYDGGDEGARDFVNGYEASILLDFNVDGVIYDKI